MKLPEPEPIGIREAKANLGALLDQVAAQRRHLLIYRRSQPLAALIPLADLERFRELVRRDEALAAVLRGRGYEVQPWSTPGVLEAVSNLEEASR